MEPMIPLNSLGAISPTYIETKAELSPHPIPKIIINIKIVVKLIYLR